MTAVSRRGSPLPIGIKKAVPVKIAYTLKIFSTVFHRARRLGTFAPTPWECRHQPIPIFFHCRCRVQVILRELDNLKIYTTGQVENVTVIRLALMPHSGWYDESPGKRLLLKSFQSHLLLAFFFRFLIRMYPRMICSSDPTVLTQ